jgi:hypothetical protein
MARDNYNQSTRRRIGTMRKGLYVERAAAVVDAAAVFPLFSVTGGRVTLTGLLGEVVVVMAGAPGTTLQITHLATVGTPVVSVLSAASADIVTYDPGRMFALPTGSGVALTPSIGSSALEFRAPEWILEVGNLAVTVTGGLATGTIKWTAWYVPVDEGAYMTAL